MNLCQCRHREQIKPGAFLCHSNRLLKTNGYVTPKGCGDCCGKGWNNLPNVPDDEGVPPLLHGSALEWSAAHPPGLGDRLAAFLEFTKLSNLAKFYEGLTGKDCGCAARREWANRQGREIRERLRRLIGR